MTLTLQSIKEHAGKTLASGVLRARLLPSGTLKSGEVFVEVTF